MLGRSHLLLAGAACAALALHPLPAPLGYLSPPLLTWSPILQPEPGAGLWSGDLLPLALSVAVAAVSGLAPDIDKTGSDIARSLGFVTRATAWVTQHALGHRGPLHSLLAAALAFLAGTVLGRRLGVDGLGAVIAFGWIVHLVADACTRRGVPLLWPLTRHHFHIPPGFATGGWAEALIVTLGLCACALWVIVPLVQSLMP